MSLRLENAAIQLDDGFYPFIAIVINGQPARVYMDQKPQLLKQDLVFLGAEWEERVDVIELPPEKHGGKLPLALYGFVRDRRLARLVLQLRAMDAEGIVQTGPIVVPGEE